MIIIGKTFGRWTVLEKAESVRYTRTTVPRWKCHCKCGTIRTVRWAGLRKGTSQSCGCLHREKTAEQNRSHGLARTSAYNSALSAFHRCRSKKSSAYRSYGGRGIEFRFRDIGDMAQWIVSNLGPKPHSSYTLDRIDNNGHYEAGNLRWASKSDQSRNVRKNVTDCSDKELIDEVNRRNGFAFIPPQQPRSIN